MSFGCARRYVNPASGLYDNTEIIVNHCPCRETNSHSIRAAIGSLPANKLFNL